MSIYKKIYVVFSNFNNKLTRGIKFGKMKIFEKFIKSCFYHSLKSKISNIYQSIDIKVLKNKMVPQNKVVKSRMLFNRIRNTL